VNFSPINSSRLNDIRIAKESDSKLQQLEQMILQWWPTHKSAVPSDIAVYFDHRDELTIQDGIVLRGDRVVIPVSLHTDMKQRVHCACWTFRYQFMFTSCKRIDTLARNDTRHKTICSGMSYLCYLSRQATTWDWKKHDLPERPWQKVGTDIFTFCERNYLVTVDYFSNFIKVVYLPDTLSHTVVTEMKLHFARIRYTWHIDQWLRFSVYKQWIQVIQ